MAVVRVADAVWEHDLLRGSGHVTGASGALPQLGVSWSARTEASGGKTSPEELLAAAHASCFSMAFSSGLSKLGHAPERLDVKATCTFDKVGDQWTVTTMELNVKGKVPGIAPAQFEEAAKAASLGCPISRALKGNVNIRVVASLA
jgi:osmotically inducible protein OsmC